MPYRATHAMKAGTDSGEVIEYKVGDVIPDVESWPTFEELKRIEWIAPVEAEKAEPGATPRPRRRPR